MPDSQEWQKILLTAVAGFLTGVLAEPLKNWASERYKKYKLRNLCYEHIFKSRSTMKSVLSALGRPTERIIAGKNGIEFAVFLITNFNLGIFKYAMEKEPALFYQLDISNTVTHVYNAFVDAADTPTPERMKQVASLVIGSIDDDVDFGRISGKKLTKLALTDRWDSRKLWVQVWSDKRPAELEALRLGYRNESAIEGKFYLTLFWPVWCSELNTSEHTGSFSKRTQLREQIRRVGSPPLSSESTFSDLLWCNAACFEERSVNNRNLCHAESPVTTACDCPEQSSCDTCLAVDLIRAAHGADIHAGRWGEAVQLRECHHRSSKRLLSPNALDRVRRSLLGAGSSAWA
jgi:hypothetical protein